MVVLRVLLCLAARLITVSLNIFKLIPIVLKTKDNHKWICNIGATKLLNHILQMGTS